MKFATCLLYGVVARIACDDDSDIKDRQGRYIVARILVVDDDQAIRLLLRAMLERRGHAVIEAKNGDEGLQYYRAAPADLVITDIQMPVLDGLQMIKELRGDFPTAQIIAISGERASSPPPRHAASARLISHCTWKNSWTPYSSSPLRLSHLSI